MSNADLSTYPLRGGLQVVAPRSLDLITPYVLEEQHDWFEDEIRFLRRLIQPGWRAIDIGANYGVYALTLGRLIGPAGVVIAVEPARATMECLQKSVVKNNLANVRLVEAALSDHDGRGELCVSAHAELNSLSGPGSAPGAREVVVLRTLDSLAENEHLSAIDFVKLDAEGEESRILEGGRRFFAEESPLIMFELKHGTTMNLQLIEQLGGIGYRCYRLVQGLGILAPFDITEEPDPFQLNLFACKVDRAARLESQGLLALPGDGPFESAPVDPSLWQMLLVDRLFFREGSEGQGGQSGAMAQPQQHGDRRYLVALSDYARAHGLPGLMPGARLRALKDAFAGLRRAAEERPTFSRLQSVARVAWELGHRLFAVQQLGQLGQRLRGGETVSLGDEPFLPVADRFDHMGLRGNAFTFVLCSVIEQREKLRAFSSYYTAPSATAELQQIWELGQGGLVDEEIGRRLQLMRRRQRPS